MSSPLVDALVIGFAPAGLSAALAFAQQGQTVWDMTKAGTTGRYKGIKPEAAEPNTARQTDSGGFEAVGASEKTSAGMLATGRLANVTIALHIARLASALILATDIVKSFTMIKQMKADSCSMNESTIGPAGKGVVIGLKDGSQSFV
ncbi:hypothetical protein NW762_011977 [Fusarium torreyae]|uniref:FAD-dependent oxidoreductase 2 FAD binding domain-containing protein n=1 Tax=Fusarium torreyae TaxID=1237075 RepID=A0A9W8RRC8_9HYPO|nr:hypothetical protein NW762_011977 [Fusarium torreyae]